MLQAKTGGASMVSIGVIAEQGKLKEWYSKLCFVEKETKSTAHLPFRVAFMEVRIG